MSDSLKEGAVHNEAVANPAENKKSGFKRHCARFWWIYLVAFIVFAVLVVVLVIFVAVPKIAQKKIDEATLTIEGIRVTNPKPESLVMSINSTIYADDSVHATIEGFTGAMYLEDHPEQLAFAHIDFPETETKKVQTVNVTQEMQITGIDALDALTTFNTWLVANKTVRVTVKGDTKVHVKGISKAYGVTFKKILEIPAHDNFAGLEVINATVSATPDENGDNFKGYVNIPNHSIFTLEVGNATFSTTFEEQNVGITVLDNMVLLPGNNSIWMHSVIDNIPVVQAYLTKPYCEGADFPFHLSGLNVTNDGQNLTYYGIALSKSVQIVDIPLGDYFQRDLGLTATCEEED